MSLDAAFGFQTPQESALASIDSTKYPDTNKDFQQNLIRLNQFVDYIASYLQVMQKGIDKNNQDPIAQIQGVASDLVVLLGGGELLYGIDLGDLQYFLPAIGALLGFDTTTPFPINLFNAAEHFLLGYVVPLDSFTTVIEGIIDGWAVALGIDQSWIDALNELLDAINDLGMSFTDLLTSVEDLLTVFGPIDDIFANIWHAVTQLFGGFDITQLGNLIDPAFKAVAPWIDELAQILEWITAIIEAFSGGIDDVQAVVNFSTLFTPFMDLLPSSGTFDPIASITSWIKNFIQPTNLLAPLEELISGTFTVPTINIPGLDASKILTGTFPDSFVPGLTDIWNTVVSALGGPASGNILDDVYSYLTNIPAANIVGQIAGGIITELSNIASYVPVGVIGGNPVELLQNPTFNGADSVETGSPWTWDSTISHGTDGTGSVKYVASGIDDTLLSDPAILVTQGQQFTISHWLMWSGITSGSGDMFKLSLNFFDNTGAATGSIDIQKITNPGVNGAWTQLAGTYTIPAGVAMIRSALNVTAAFAHGVVNWDDGSLKATGTMPQNLVSGLISDLAARVLGTDFMSLLNNLGLGTFADIPTALTSIANRFLHMGATGLFDSANLTNIANIPMVAQSRITGLVTDLANRVLGTDFMSLLNNLGLGTFASIPAALTAIANRFVNMGGSGLFNSASLTNIANIPMIGQDRITGLINSLANTVLNSDFMSLLNNLGLGTFSTVPAALTAITNRFFNMSATGIFDSSKLGNIANIPQLLVTSVAGIGGAPNIGSSVQQSWDHITNAFIGAGSQFAGASLPQTRGSMDSIYNNVINAVQNIQMLRSQNQGQAVTGVAVNVDFSNYADGPLPSSFTTVYSGSGTSTIGIKSGNAGWRVLNNDGNRTAIITYNVAPTNTDFQIVRGSMASAPAVASSGGQPRIWAIGRVDNPGNPQNYVWARAYCTGFLAYKADVGYTVNGVDTVIQSGIALTWSLDISVIFGVNNNPRQYQAYSGTTLVATVTETGTGSQIGAGFRYWGAKAEMKTGSGSASDSGQIAGTAVSDNATPSVLGSTFRVHRNGTTNVSTGTGSKPAPASFFDTLDYISPDMLWDGTTLTINTEGTYLFVLRYDLVSMPGNSKATALVYQNTALSRLLGGDFADGSIAANSANSVDGASLLYVHAGDTFNPGYNFSSSSSITGEATGVACYFEVALVNRSTA